MVKKDQNKLSWSYKNVDSLIRSCVDSRFGVVWQVQTSRSIQYMSLSKVKSIAHVCYFYEVNCKGVLIMCYTWINTCLCEHEVRSFVMFIGDNKWKSFKLLAYTIFFILCFCFLYRSRCYYIYTCWRCSWLRKLLFLSHFKKSICICMYYKCFKSIWRGIYSYFEVLYKWLTYTYV